MIVLLVHGLGRTSMSMKSLGRRLAKSGHDPQYFGYSAWTESQSRILERLVGRLRDLAARQAEVGLVGHSFGGLLLREAAARVPELRVRHLVMLATPNRPPRLARVIYKRLPFRILRGSCGQCLASPEWFERLPPVSSPYTVVAGTRGWPAWLGPFGGEANDGIVAVSETVVGREDEPVLLPVAHTFIMNSKSVHRLIAARLANEPCEATAP